MIFKSKSKEIATLTLCLGTLFIFPPIILIFNKPFSVFGIPVSVVYLFGVWITLIICSALISRNLSDPNA